MNTSVLNIEGMGCSGCVDTVENTLSALPGVKSVTVNLQKGTAMVDFDEQEVSETEFKQAIKEAGYTMTGIQG
ncbi:heavy-metal-associated domain-containing protein [Gracilimonas sp.]|uniref:heavy-metal-associated domain-containing protein n=1 Tax=Gracilimonas sp. TaxID=1974203 RepID=UPI0025C4884C|nr:heavy-metal-associated domain-containing protein [Gracilimonas sp.]